ncbi:WG repeat-containing protein [Flavobacterium sp. LAR06]|uniref:WG repeat-containing protein n=1 Tax=Flavobacterium sp. LAR06 TaxID=3064897 RepID=UPI0035C07298
MKKIFLLLLILNQFSGFSQTAKLYYFIEKDSLLGVKNQNGKIIIPAAYTMSPSIYDGILKEEIKENIIFFWVSKEGQKVYDRKGNFLFEPYLFDACVDDFSEGLMRFSENKKLGFADRNGNKIIPAKYDWVSSMNFGFSQYCQGCYFDRSKDDEHPTLVGGTWGYVDKKGNEIIPTNKRNHQKDFETENHQFIPYQFQYNDKEKQILDYFEKRKESIIKIYKIDCTVKDLYFEIVQQPSKLEPFYTVKTFEVCDQYFHGANETYDDYKIFKVSADGKEFYALYIDLVAHKKYSEYVKRKIPVDKWIKKSLKK